MAEDDDEQEEQATQPAPVSPAPPQKREREEEEEEEGGPAAKVPRVEEMNEGEDVHVLGEDQDQDLDQDQDQAPEGPEGELYESEGQGNLLMDDGQQTEAMDLVGEGLESDQV